MKETRQEEAYRHIRRRMIDGTLPPGKRLSPVTLASEIGISHIPVREAIGRLKSEGLVVHQSHRGAFVKKINRRDIVDLVEFRTLLECRAAAQAARHISFDQLRELDERWREFCRVVEGLNVLPEMDDLRRMADYVFVDLSFHMLLFRAAGNHRMIRAIEDAQVLVQMFGYRNDHPRAWANPQAFWAKNLQVHKNIYDAVRRHDAKAARRAMAMHMRRAGKNMLGRFDWLQRHADEEPHHVVDYPDSVRERVREIERHGSL